MLFSCITLIFIFVSLFFCSFSFASSIYLAFLSSLPLLDTPSRIVGLEVKAEDHGFEFRLRRDFSDLKMGTPMATLAGSWRYRVSTGTGWPGVSIL